MAVNNEVYFHTQFRMYSLKRAVPFSNSIPGGHTFVPAILPSSQASSALFIVRWRALVFMSPLGNPRPYVTFTLCFDHKFDYLGWPYSWFTYFAPRGFLSTAPNQITLRGPHLPHLKLAEKTKYWLWKHFQGTIAISQKPFIKGSREALACIWP